VAARYRSTRKMHGGEASGLSETRWILVTRLDLVLTAG
jgi:hypothetical protein